jgi:hypothetical protein
MSKAQLAASPSLSTASFPTQTRTRLVALFLLVTLLTPSFSAFLRPAVSSKAALLYAFEYSALTDTFSRGLNLSMLNPIPDYTHGRIGWYRQGLREVIANRRIIERSANDNVASILIAAAIANQGNSVQRPFGWNGLERIQVWLGLHADWPWPSMESIDKFWKNAFQQPSVGIAQLMEHEGGPLVRNNYNMLFDDGYAIRHMAKKLTQVEQEAAAFGLNETRKFVLIAIGNNIGPGAIRALHAYGGDIERYVSEDSSARRQLAKMMTYVDYLHERYDWPMPEGINRDYIWWLIRRGSSVP